MLRIDRIDLFVCGAPMDFSYSRWKNTKSRSVVYRVQAGKFVGWGEATARHGAFHVATIWARLLLGRDPLAFRTNLSLTGRADVQSDFLARQRLQPVRVVREGLSIAHYDLAGQVLGKPVYELLGGKRRSIVPGKPVVHVAEPKDMEAMAAKWVNVGFRFLKIKLRGDIDKDSEAIGRIRKAVGPDVHFHVDGNFGFRSLRDVTEMAKRLAQYDVRFFEDPMRGSPEEWAVIRRAIKPLQLMLDSYATWPRVKEYVNAGGADVVNHHPNFQHGLDTALLIDKAATDAGLITTVGASGTFGISNTAFQVLSTIIGLTGPCEDLGMGIYVNGPVKGHYHMPVDPSVLDEPYEIRDGMIKVPDKPGLGITVNTNKLERLVEHHVCLSL